MLFRHLLTSYFDAKLNFVKPGKKVKAESLFRGSHFFFLCVVVDYANWINVDTTYENRQENPV